MAVLVKHQKNVTIADDATAAAAGQVVPSDWNAGHTFTGTASTVLGFDGSGNATEVSTTGTGNLVRATSAALTTPDLGTPSAATLTNATGLPLTTGVTGTLPVANGGTGVATVTGILKGNGTSAFSAATAGTDYLAPGGALGTPSSGTLTNCTGLPVSTGVSGLGTGVATFLATPSSANLASAVTDETGSGALVFATSPTLTTPTLGVASATSINKVALTAPATSATLTIADGKTLTANNSITLAGTDSTTMTFPSSSATIAGLGVAQTFTGTQTFAGTSSVIAAIFNDAAEVATVSATAATGTINYDVSTQSVIYYTSNASANWTINFRHSSGTSLNTAMSTGQAITVAFLVTQGASAFFNNAVQVDGSSVTPLWQGGTAPTTGNASSVDVYTYTIVKTGSAAFTVLASQTQFK